MVSRPKTFKNSSDHEFDMVLLDIMMPRMSGYEVCKELRKKYLASQLPIVMLTAKNQVKNLVEAFNVGANDYLTKPFVKDELLSRIKTHLNLHLINKATGKFVPVEFLKVLGRETITEVKLGDNHEQEVTVFFSDIRSYTTLAETMTPDENFRFVNAYNRRMGPIIEDYDGFINQYLGDGLMSIFADSPTKALTAAVEMQLELQSYNHKRLTDKRRPIRVGMGLHTGLLIMGITGDGKRMDATTVSNAVNTAARIEGLNKHFKTNILISEDTLRKIDDSTKFPIRHLGPVQMKGQERPVDIYECFGGDKPEMLDKKLATLARFNEGLEAYFKKEFLDALHLFTEITKQNPGDKTALLFLNKCQSCLETGILDGWTGIEMMTSK